LRGGLGKAGISADPGTEKLSKAYDRERTKAPRNNGEVLIGAALREKNKGF